MLAGVNSVVSAELARTTSVDEATMGTAVMDGAGEVLPTEAVGTIVVMVMMETGATLTGTVEVWTMVECAGQTVTVDGHEVIVTSFVEYFVLYTTDSVRIGVAVTGQTNVVRETTSVLATVLWAGHCVTVGAQLVTV